MMENILFIIQKIGNLFEKIIHPKSKSEDSRRREFILNVLLLGLITLSVVASGISIIQSIVLETYRGLSPLIAATVLLSFVFLYFLSRKGFVRPSAYGLLVVFFLPITYQIYNYGVDLPSALLSYTLIIVMAGVLISARFAFVMAFIISLTLTVVSYFQIKNVINPSLYWKDELIGMADITIFPILFFILATVSWLSNREIEKSLTRARKSEADLKKERDSLEITVEERTRELKETQVEKMTQLYRFAEFGRISSSLFHDLINPLTAVSLNLEQVKGAGETKQYAARAVAAAKRLEDLVAAVRKQLSRQENKVIFSLDSEIRQAIEVLLHKAMMANVAILFPPGTEIKTYGDPVKFNQVAFNLIANAIDAGGKTAEISLTSEKDEITLSVKDDGAGIKGENISKIFEPFFTTKAEGYGLGIGLSIVKRIVEKDFGGTIEVKSQAGNGSVFTIKFPKRNSI